MNTVRFEMEPDPPFRLDLTVWALRRRPKNSVDRWDGRVYRRILLFNDQPVEAAVSQTGAPDEPKLTVEIRGDFKGEELCPHVVSALEWMLGTKTDLSRFYEFAERDIRLWELVRPFIGFKLPRYHTLFEALVNGIACQQLTLEVGIQIMNRIAQSFGPQFEDGAHAFPNPESFLVLNEERLKLTGLSTQKARSVIFAANSVLGDKVNRSELLPLDNASAVDRLRTLRGVGRWTAEYVLLRGLGRWDVYPSGDSGARKGMLKWLALQGQGPSESAAEITRLMEQWSPYGGLIYLHLLLRKLLEEGHIQ